MRETPKFKKYIVLSHFPSTTITHLFKKILNEMFEKSQTRFAMILKFRIYLTRIHIIQFPHITSIYFSF